MARCAFQLRLTVGGLQTHPSQPEPLEPDQRALRERADESLQFVVGLELAGAGFAQISNVWRACDRIMGTMERRYTALAMAKAHKTRAILIVIARQQRDEPIPKRLIQRNNRIIGPLFSLAEEAKITISEQMAKHLETAKLKNTSARIFPSNHKHAVLPVQARMAAPSPWQSWPRRCPTWERSHTEWKNTGQERGAQARGGTHYPLAIARRIAAPSTGRIAEPPSCSVSARLRAAARILSSSAGEALGRSMSGNRGGAGLASDRSLALSSGNAVPA
eukprot:scaffold8542_cov119-Isochrysis_galbana.AAC.7